MDSAPIEHVFRSIYRMIMDVIIIIILVLPSISLKWYMASFQRGFFCDDKSIMYPYHESTISEEVAEAVGLMVPIFFKIVCETFCTRQLKYGYVCVFGDKKKYVLPFIGRLYSTVVIFVFGSGVWRTLPSIPPGGCGLIFPMCANLSRQHTYNCLQVYITKFTCTGTDQILIKNARLFLPSCHRSDVMYCMLYLAIYVHVASPRRLCLLVKGIIKVAAITLGIYTCLTRITVYKHHWNDVVCGGLLDVVCLIGIGGCTDLLKKLESSQNTELRHRDFHIHKPVLDAKQLLVSEIIRTDNTMVQSTEGNTELKMQ